GEPAPHLLRLPGRSARHEDQGRWRDRQLLIHLMDGWHGWDGCLYGSEVSDARSHALARARLRPLQHPGERHSSRLGANRAPAAKVVDGRGRHEAVAGAVSEAVA